jgi:hypothetical protein
MLLASMSIVDIISMQPYWLCPLVRLVLSSPCVALVDTMASLHIIRSNFSLVWDIVIRTPAQDPIVEDATCKNKLYLSGKSVEWFLVKDFKPIFQCSKSPLMITLRLECLRLNNSSAFCALFLGDNSFR